MNGTARPRRAHTADPSIPCFVLSFWNVCAVRCASLVGCRKCNFVDVFARFLIAAAEIPSTCSALHAQSAHTHVQTATGSNKFMDYNLTFFSANRSPAQRFIKYCIIIRKTINLLCESTEAAQILMGSSLVSSHIYLSLTLGRFFFFFNHFSRPNARNIRGREHGREGCLS